MRCKTPTKLLETAIVTLLTIVTVVGPLAADAIKVSSKSRTKKDFDATITAWRYRTVVTGYEKYGNHTAKWDAAAKKFISDYHKEAARTPGTRYSTAIISEGQALVAQGCSDAMVLSCYGNILQDNGDSTKAAPILQRAADLLPKSNYRKARACIGIGRLIQVKRQTGKLTNKDYEALIDRAASYMGQSMTDGSFAKGEQRVMLNVLYCAFESYYNPGRAGLRKSLTKQKNIDPYFLKAVCGMMEVEDAWAARGDGWGNTVTQDGWKKFYSHLQASSKLLTAAWKMHPEYPEVPTTMIKVAMGLAEGESDGVFLWFDRAVAAQFDHMDAYSQLEWALRPRWLGSIPDLQEFAVSCYNTKRFDTGVPLMFLNTLYVIESESGSRTYWKNAETQKRLRVMFDGYAKSGYGGGANWIRTMEAGVDAHIGKRTEAKAILKKLGSKADMATFYQLCGMTPSQFLGTSGKAPTKAPVGGANRRI